MGSPSPLKRTVVAVWGGWSWLPGPPGAILREPAAHLGVLRAAGFLGQVYPGLLQFARSTKQKNVLHC